MRIRLIENTDNVKIATVIRSVIIEMGVPKVGTAYEDVELDNMFQAYQKNHFVYYVVEDGDRVLGGAGIAPLKNSSPSICELQKMYFLSEARGKGIGKRMIEKCLSFAKANDFEQCYIETLPIMQEAQKLYIKTGFEYIDHALGDTGHSSCQIRLIKSL
jgi:putative acetyltransferase